MVKKQSAEAGDSTPAAPAAGASAETKTKEPKPAKEKAAKGKEKTSLAAPAAPASPTAGVPEGGSTAPTAPVAPVSTPAAPTEAKKTKRPGISPPRGKKLRNHLRNARQKLSKEGATNLKRAIQLLKQMKRAKFDETVEIHMCLGVDTTQSDQLVRGTVSLPHGVGKSVRVLVFCQGDNIAKAKEGGADFAGSDELIKKIQSESWTDFDVALATQDMMGQVSRLGKILGPRGLMPTPKAGTVITGDIANSVREFKAGKVEYRTDKGGNVHAGVGKMSFDEEKLAANVTTFVDQVKAVKPAGVKGNYVKSITLSATMSAGIPVAL